MPSSRADHRTPDDWNPATFDQQGQNLTAGKLSASFPGLAHGCGRAAANYTICQYDLSYKLGFTPCYRADAVTGGEGRSREDRHRSMLAISSPANCCQRTTVAGLQSSSGNPTAIAAIATPPRSTGLFCRPRRLSGMVRAGAAKSRHGHARAARCAAEAAW